MTNYEKELMEFLEKFGTEEQCRNYLFNLRWPEGFRCPKCNYDKKWDLSEVKFKCKKCRHQTSLISGTIFQGSHQPLTRWFLAIKYITMEPEKTNASELQVLTGLGSNHTALKWWHTLREIMLCSKQYRYRNTITFQEFMGCVASQAEKYEEISIDDFGD